MAYVYAFHFVEEPDLFYIGKTVNPVNVRLSAHIRDMQNQKHHSVKVQNMYNKYIQEFNAVHDGLNMTVPRGIDHHSTKHSKMQILKVFALLINKKLSYEDISERTKVSIGLIKGIRRGVNHSWFAEEYPEKWLLLKNIPHTTVAVTSLAHQNKQLPSFISPEGIVYSDVENMREFVRSHTTFTNIDTASKGFSSMYRGTVKSYKGWKLYPQN
jgi:hypothetical protein